MKVEVYKSPPNTHTRMIFHNLLIQRGITVRSTRLNIYVATRVILKREKLTLLGEIGSFRINLLIYFATKLVVNVSIYCMEKFMKTKCRNTSMYVYLGLIWINYHIKNQIFF